MKASAALLAGCRYGSAGLGRISPTPDPQTTVVTCQHTHSDFHQSERRNRTDPGSKEFSMKSLLSVMAILAVGAGAAIGPSPMSSAFAAVRDTVTSSQPPHYEWRDGYEHGKWHSHWVLVK